ncbi:MAG: hypothetical protein ACM3O7_09340 [Acidobacteriota bacterium]
MKRICSLAAATALIAASSGGAALAAKTYDTTISISYSRGSGAFAGDVGSKHHACVTGRKVTVYRQQSGKDSAVGSDRSSANGSWKVNPPGKVAAGDYYAKTASVQLGAKVCRGARSVTTHAS